jgi:hypothetical protein
MENKMCLFLSTTCVRNKFCFDVYLASLARASHEIRAEKRARLHVDCLSLFARISPELECINKLMLVISAYRNRLSHCLILVKKHGFESRPRFYRHENIWNLFCLLL